MVGAASLVETVSGPHPAWWIEHLEYLEAIDSPGGVAYGASVDLRAPVIMSLERRGLVTTSVQVVDVQSGGGRPERLSFPWVKLTDRGRRVFDGDLPPTIRFRSTE